MAIAAAQAKLHGFLAYNLGPLPPLFCTPYPPHCFPLPSSPPLPFPLGMAVPVTVAGLEALASTTPQPGHIRLWHHDGFGRDWLWRRPFSDSLKNQPTCGRHEQLLSCGFASDIGVQDAQNLLRTGVDPSVIRTSINEGSNPRSHTDSHSNGANLSGTEPYIAGVP